MTEQGPIEPQLDAELEDALMGELDIVDDQPLSERAQSFARIHDRLQAELNGQ